MPNPLLQNENQELLYVEVYSQYNAGSGIDITSGVISLDPYISASIDSKLASADFGTYSAGVAQDIAYVSANAGKTYSGIAPIVVNDTTISADNFDLIIGSGLAFENNTLYVSAQQGNPEVESIVQTNSGLWNDVSAYQIASGDYATTSQLDTASSYLSGQIDNKLDKSDIGFDNDSTYVTGISGKEISASRAYKSYSSTYSYLSDNADKAVLAQTAQFDENGHSLSSTYSSLYDLSSFVNSSSGAWNDGKIYSGISPIVVNNTTNEISADSQDISFGTGLDFTSGVLSVTAQGGDPEVESVVKANSGDWGTITALSSTSAMLSGAIDYVSGNIPEGFTGVNHDNNLSGDGNTIPLGLASSLQLVDNSIYTTAIYNGGGVGIEGIMPRIQLKTNNSSYNTLGEGGMTVTHSASSVGGGYTISHYGEKISLSYNDGDYYLHTVDTTKSGLGVTYKGSPNVKAYYNYSGVALTTDNGATNEYVSVDSIRNWNGVYDTVNTNSSTWGGGNPEVESYVQTNSGVIDDAVSSYQTNSAVFNAKQDTLTFGYDTNDAISSINSSAISDSRQGTDLYVQSPLFVGTSGTSAYIGWNNETLLWSGSLSTVGQSATLSEPISSFNNIEITIKDQNGYSNIQKFETGSSGYNTSMLTQYPGRNNTFIQRLAFLTVPDQNHLQYTSGCRAVISAGTPDFQMNGPIVTKIIGIGRKQ